MKFLEMKTIEKQGSIKKMREIRDQLNKQFVDMTYEEEKKYIKKELEKLKRKTSDKKTNH